MESRKFEDLPQDVKDKALENYRDMNTDHEWWHCSVEEFTGELEKYGFNDAKIYFSGFNSQGDGACFDADCDVSKLIKIVYPKPCYERSVLELLADNGPRISLSIQKNSWGHHYSHSNTRYVEYDTDMNDIEKDFNEMIEADILSVPPMITNEYEDHVLTDLIALRLAESAPALRLQDLLSSFEEKVEDLRKDLSDDMYKRLEGENDYLCSDEAIIETFKCNEYEFDEEGKIA